ncbi:Ku protein [Streptomyces sp. DT195]|uniref:Ku protein n=1 Tax=Streptomyces sp. DT195 TaxID=3393419 RepID=UPI003CF57846
MARPTHRAPARVVPEPDHAPRVCAPSPPGAPAHQSAAAWTPPCPGSNLLSQARSGSKQAVSLSCEYCPGSSVNGTVPIHVVGATPGHSVHFRQVHRADGGRIRNRKICELDGHEVPDSEIGCAYEASMDHVVLAQRRCRRSWKSALTITPEVPAVRQITKTQSILAAPRTRACPATNNPCSMAICEPSEDLEPEVHRSWRRTATPPSGGAAWEPSSAGSVWPVG